MDIQKKMMNKNVESLKLRVAYKFIRGPPYMLKN